MEMVLVWAIFFRRSCARAGPATKRARASKAVARSMEPPGCNWGIIPAIIPPGGNLVAFSWWLLRRPSNTRDWQPDVARVATAEIRGDQATVRNVRNFRYRSA